MLLDFLLASFSFELTFFEIRMQLQDEIDMSSVQRAYQLSSMQMITCDRSAALSSLAASAASKRNFWLPPLPPGVIERPSHVSCTGVIRMLIASICAMLLHGSDAPVPFFSQLLNTPSYGLWPGIHQEGKKRTAARLACFAVCCNRQVIVVTACACCMWLSDRLHVG